MGVILCTVLPSYVTRLVGFYESYGGMCAASKSDAAVVCSKDGKKWNIMPNVDHADILANAVPPTAVPGLPESELQVTNFETWSVDFTGVSKDGNLRAKWTNCCS
ncbi:hypothetical protein E2C01_095564 [Portunus trituberculatus]|uniref:Uncharacterized protein n=1 Tax=Portunus trituberculatus TaxID=210409 RepID=A0A5B7JVL3_PORTR|nr:hypothetical protein [Portunus trituberculatus]